MRLLKDQHGSEADGVGTAAANVDTKLLGLDEELVALGVVKGDESTLALAAEVLEVLRVLLGELLDLAIEVVSDLGGLLDEVVALDLLDDGAEEDGAGRVAHPGVELAVGLVGAELGVSKVVASGLSLLGEGDHVRGSGKVPVVVGPELASGTDTSLDLVDDQENVVLLGELTQTTEKGGGGVVVTTLRLDGLDDDGGRGQVPRLDELLDLCERIGLGLGVLLNVLLQRVLELGEGSLRPVEGGNVELVDGLGAGGGERAKQTAVETGLEGQDGELRSTRRLVVHGSLHLLLGKLNGRATSLLLPPPHESCLVCRLVGVGTGHGGEDLVQALGGNLEDTGLENLSPVVGGEVAECGSVDDGVDHLGALSSLDEGWVVVTDRDRGNLGVAGLESVFLSGGDCCYTSSLTHRGECCHRGQQCSCRNSWCSRRACSCCGCRTPCPAW